METAEHIEKEDKSDKSLAFDLCNSMGILTFLFLLFYFLIMRAMHLHEATILSAFNIIVIFIGLLLTYSIYSKRIKSKIEFNQGIKMGLRVTLLAIVPFSLFIAFYLHVDDSFMSFIQQHTPFGQYLDPNTTAVLVCIQGLIAGAFLSFLLMLFYKKRQA